MLDQIQMSEKKKFMPAITNYLSDSDDEVNSTVETNTNCDSKTPQAQINYAEWKRLQKETPNLPNGIKKSVHTPLGDISSCEDDSKFDDNEPLFKIMSCLADKEAFRKRNESVRRRQKKPSHFLLFSRMKQQKHFNCSFSDLCHITQASWDNMQAAENEELMGNIEHRIRDYKEVLSKFRQTLLPDSKSRPKYNSWVSAAAASKQESHIPSPTPIDTLLTSKKPAKIPERLQSLAGDASIYNAPEKSKRVTRHSSKFNTKSNSKTSYNTDTSLNYVAAINSNHNCNNFDCENKPVEDYRWNGQYCSAKCLIKDCQMAFNGWLTDSKQLLSNGDQISEEMINNDSDVMVYLASPSPLRDGSSDGSISRDENLFESLQKNPPNTINKIVSETLIDDDDEVSQKLHSFIKKRSSSKLASSDQLESFESFRDQELVTKTA